MVINYPSAVATCFQIHHRRALQVSRNQQQGFAANPFISTQEPANQCSSDSCGQRSSHPLSVKARYDINLISPPRLWYMSIFKALIAHEWENIHPPHSLPAELYRLLCYIFMIFLSSSGTLMIVHYGTGVIKRNWGSASKIGRCRTFLLSQ